MVVYICQSLTSYLCYEKAFCCLLLLFVVVVLNRVLC